MTDLEFMEAKFPGYIEAMRERRWSRGYDLAAVAVKELQRKRREARIWRCLRRIERAVTAPHEDFEVHCMIPSREEVAASIAALLERWEP